MSSGYQNQLQEIANLIGVLGANFAMGSKTPLLDVEGQVDALLSKLPVGAIDSKFSLYEVTKNDEHQGVECTLLYYAALLNFTPAMNILMAHEADFLADAYFNRNDYNLLLEEAVQESLRIGTTVTVTVEKPYMNALQGAMQNGAIEFIERWVTIAAPVIEEDIAYAESVGLSKPAEELLLTALTTYMAEEVPAEEGVACTGDFAEDLSAEAL